MIQGADGNLNGTTYFGGLYDGGTIFKIDTSGTTLTTLHDFTGGNDSAYPRAGLIQAANGNLYGTVTGLDTFGYGTVFKIGANGSSFTTLHTFVNSDGSTPQADMVQATDGNLYGTTSYGGVFSHCRFGCGTVFKIGTGGTSFTTLHRFDGDGANPTAGLIQGTDGNLYGTTTGGGASGHGTIFKIDTNGSALTTLHSFAGSEGEGPRAGLIQGTDGNLYGTTYWGGSSGDGTIFSIDASGSAFTTLHSFVNSDGANPAGLIQGTDGNLYGTTKLGGANSAGVVFRLIPGTPFQITGWPPPPARPRAERPSALQDRGSSPRTRSRLAVWPQTGVTWVSPTQIDAMTPALSPGTLNDLVATKPDLTTAELPNAYLADFLDVAQSDVFHDFVEKIFRRGITAGIGGGNYGRDNPVTRAQMAIFLLKAVRGSSYTPPACTPPGLFGDVPCPGGFAVDWIEQLSIEGITAGCGQPGRDGLPRTESVTRAQMAVFLLQGRAWLGLRATGLQRDLRGRAVSRAGFAVDWIEQLASEGITAGCGGSPLTTAPTIPTLARRWPSSSL